MRRYIRKVNMLGSFNPTTTERRAAHGTKPTGFLALFEM